MLSKRAQKRYKRIESFLMKDNLTIIRPFGPTLMKVQLTIETIEELIYLTDKACQIQRNSPAQVCL